MNRTDLIHALTLARILHRLERDHVFVAYADAPGGTAKGRVVDRLVGKLAQVARVGIANDGVQFIL